MMKFAVAPQQIQIPTEGSALLQLCETQADECRCESRHGELLPSNVRGLIAGPSNCGKTNVVISLLVDPNGLKFENVYIYSKTLYQKSYVELAKIFSLVPEIGYFCGSSEDEILSVEETKPNSVIIFDDLAPKDMSKIADYYSRGRHKNLNTFFLTQTYTNVKKQMLRDNVNVIVCFKMDRLNLYCIYRDHVTPDISFPAKSTHF
jgi:Poxvirus A32 protein